MIVSAACILLAVADAGAARAKKINAPRERDPEAVPGIFDYGYREIIAYNQGVTALDEKDYAAAQRHFEKALDINEKFPEAHNNLAYSSRMQGPENAEASLAHYNRAIALAPELAQAYLYRGMLFVQLDRMNDAEKDLAALKGLDTDEARAYAKELARVIKRRTTHDAADALSVYGLIKQR